MPAFQNPYATGKRKHPYDESNLPESKRAALARESHLDSPSDHRPSAYWIVQWHVFVRDH